MKWAKGSQYIEIEKALSVDSNSSVFIVSSSSSLADLPIEFRGQVPCTDESRSTELREAVTQWAERNGYVQVS